MRKLSALQEKYFGKGRKAKAKRRAHKPRRSLGGASGRGMKKPVATFAEKNGNGGEEA